MATLPHLRVTGAILLGAAALAAMGFGGGPADRALAEAERLAAGFPREPAWERFTLNGVVIDGVSVYSRTELAPLYLSLIHI